MTVQVFIYLLFFGAAFLVYKRRSTLHIAIAAGLFASAWSYQPWGSSWIWTGVCVGLALGLAQGISRGVIAELKADTREAVQFTVGEIISNSNDTFVTTNVSIGRDAFGDARATTSHEYHSSHTTWIKDLLTGKESKIGGDGHLEARSGHIFGFARYQGRTMMDVNYTTENVFSMKPPSVATQAVIAIIGGLLLGWVLFPVFILCTVLQSRWPNVFRPKNGGAITPGFAGSAAYDKLYIIGSSVCYGLAILMAMTGHALIPTLMISGLLLVISIIVIPVYCLMKLRARHAELMIYCEQQLDQLYGLAKAQAQAKSAAARKIELALV